MGKNRGLVVMLIAVIIVCIVLVANAAGLSSKLNAERSKAAALTAQISDLESQLSDARSAYDEQVRIVRGLQNSLDAARKEAQDAKMEAENLRTTVRDLQSKISTPAPASAE